MIRAFMMLLAISLNVVAGGRMSLALGCTEFKVRWLAYSGAPPTVVPGTYPADNTFILIGQVTGAEPGACQ